MDAQSPARLKTSPALQLLLASPIIWSVYHVGMYLFVEATCTAGLLTGRILGLEARLVIISLLTLLALAATVWIGLLSFRRWRAEDENGAGDENRERFLGLVGGWFSVILALIILADGVSIWVLGSCG